MFCAIDKTIKLNVAIFEAEEDATAKVAIFALNEEGEKTGTAIVTDAAAEIKDDVVVFDVSGIEFGDDEYLVEVTIGDVTESVNVTVEFDAVEKLVKDINKANKAELVGLIEDLEGFDIANIDEYHKALNGKNLKTVKAVQDKIAEVNKDAGAVSYFAEFEKALKEAKGEYAKYLVLKEYFQFVDDANMDKYMATTNGNSGDGPIFKDKFELVVEKVEEVQNAIDQINLDAVIGDPAPTIGEDSKLSDLNELKAALLDLELVNKEDTKSNNKTKAEWLEAIDEQLGKIDEAKDAAQDVIEAAEAAMVEYEAVYDGDEDIDEVEAYKNVKEAIEGLEELLAKKDVTEKAITDMLNNDKDDFESDKIKRLKEATDAITGVADAAAFKEDYAEVLELSLTPEDENQVEYTDLPAIQEALAAYDKLGDTAKRELSNEKTKLTELELSAMSRFLVDVNLAGPTPLVELLEFVGNAQYAKLDSVQKREVAELFKLEIKPDYTVWKDSNSNLDNIRKDFEQTIVIDLAKTVSNYKAYLNDINAATTYAEMEEAIKDLAKAYKYTEDEDIALFAIKVLDGRPEGGFELFAEIFDLVK